MIKLETIGMYKNVKNDPTVKAHAEIPNGYVFTINADHKTAAPTATTAKALDLWFAMNTRYDDDRHTDAKIAQDEYVNAYLLKEFDHQNLIVDEDNLTTAATSLAVGDTLVVDTNGKFAKETTLTGYKVYLKIVEKIQMGEKAAVRAQVVLA